MLLSLRSLLRKMGRSCPPHQHCMRIPSGEGIRWCALQRDLLDAGGQQVSEQQGEAPYPSFRGLFFVKIKVCNFSPSRFCYEVRGL